MEGSNYWWYGYKTQHSYPRSRLITWRRPEVKFGRNVVRKTAKTTKMRRKVHNKKLILWLRSLISKKGFPIKTIPILSSPHLFFVFSFPFLSFVSLVCFSFSLLFFVFLFLLFISIHFPVTIQFTVLLGNNKWLKLKECFLPLPENDEYHYTRTFWIFQKISLMDGLKMHWL